MQVRLTVPAAPESELERLTESLFDLGAIAVERIDGAEAAQIVADFERGRTDAQTISRSIASLGFALVELKVSTVERSLPQYWRRRLPSVRVGPLVVTSAPEEIDAGIAVVIEPGMASGTAHLEGTILCLETLVRRLGREKPASILDVGTGTGLLAISSLLLGVERAVATDIDPHALAVARRNAVFNRVERRLVLSTEDPASLGERFELVLANLPDRVLLQMLPSILAAAAPGGHAVLTATNEVDCVVETIGALGGEMVERSERNGWTCLVVRPQGAY